MRNFSRAALSLLCCLTLVAPLAAQGLGNGAGNANPGGPGTTGGLGSSGTSGSNGGAAGGGQGAGGGGAADFDSLMNLIRTTIEPDTWSDNGGSSTMEPYFGGILLNPKALAAKQNGKTTAASNSQTAGDAERVAARGQRQGVLAPAAAAAWKEPSTARSVSLRALQAQLAKRVEAGQRPDEVMHNLAGLTRIYAVLVPEDRSDIILVGSVGPLVRDERHGWCDGETGRPTIRLEDLTTMLKTVTENRSIGCSIDPTREGLAAVQKTANDLRSGKIKGAAANKELAASLGPQKVTLTGMSLDDPASLAFVAADRHMKMVALNQAKSPAGINNYFKWVEKLAAKHGLPDGQLLRFWFTASPVPVAQSKDGLAWAWNRTPICLLSEKEMADANGGRQAAGQDPRAIEFAKQMTEHFAELPKAEPIYGRLAGLFELGLGLALAKEAITDHSQWHAVIGTLGTPDEWQMRLMVPPQFVPSLVASHQFREGKKQHLVTVISGGIELRPQSLVAASKRLSESRVDQLQQRTFAKANDTTESWWWDHQ